ncbi:MAG: hypothetical protein JST14_12085 [Bacteroidetes bacterium]|nr:hypothetical protein [Bacteroidota bacterium]
MKRLEDIPKKDIFEAPEGYFDRLPSVIQSRVTTESSSRWTLFAQPAWKYALSLVFLAAGLYWFLLRPEPQSPEQMLASVDTISLIAYLNESDMSTEEILESVPLNNVDADEIQAGSLQNLLPDDSTLMELESDVEFEN